MTKVLLLTVLLSSVGVAQTTDHVRPPGGTDHTGHSHPPATPGKEPDKGSARPGQAGLEITWHHSWDEAVAAAKKIKDGRILLELVDAGCGECERMEALIVPSTSFYALMRDKVAVQLNRKSADGKRFADRFGIDRTPAFFILTTDEVVSGYQVGSTSQEGWFSTFADAERSWGIYKRRLSDEEKNPGDLSLVFQVAQETYKRRGDAIAEPRFRRISKDAAAPADLREQSLAYLASIYLDSQRIEDAVKALDTLASTAKDPVLKERAEIRRAEVEIARGRKDLAAARLKDFKKAHPESPRMADVDELLRALSGGAGGASTKGSAKP